MGCMVWSQEVFYLDAYYLRLAFFMLKILCYSDFAELNASCNGVINCYLNYLKPGIKGLGVDADKLSHVGRGKFSILFFLYIL